MVTRKRLGDWVARRVDELLVSGTEARISVLCEAIEPEVPISMVSQGLHPAVADMVRKHLKYSHHVSIERGEDRERVWRQVELLSLDECVGVLASKLAAIEVDQLRIRMDAKVWVEAHPEAQLTVEALLALAHAAHGHDDDDN